MAKRRIDVLHPIDYSGKVSNQTTQYWRQSIVNKIANV
jgi:hypothetical protein